MTYDVLIVGVGGQGVLLASRVIGEAAMRAKAATGDPDIRKTWILFGDPATRLRAGD